MKHLTILFLFLSIPFLAEMEHLDKYSANLVTQMNSATRDTPLDIWVYFTDKGSGRSDLDLTAIRNGMKTRTIWRRGKTRRDHLVDERDFPVVENYVQQVLAMGAELRTRSRWLNAISVTSVPDVLPAIRSLPFVKRIDLVLKGKRIDISPNSGSGNKTFQNSGSRTDYGESFGQLDQINAIQAHDAGYKGQGVLVLMLDTGFYKDHESIEAGRIIDEWDFINNDDETDNEDGDPENAHNHGTYTMSTLGGASEGQLFGPAYEADFLLAKTEDVSQEEPIEEDWYVAGLEWGESLGADVVSSSLGYIDWYTPEDLDGETAVTTIAVNIAIENGMVVATAAGNSGENGLIAPADAFDVITCGAVNVYGELAGFSSRGPTADGRIKPDVCAQGVNTYCADIDSPSSYRTANGTSLSTPLIGGAAAVILSARPNWTPTMVREALMMTANNSENPNNDYGWGVIDIMAALNYFPTIGDVNEDETLDVLDIVMIVNFILGNDIPTELQLITADINIDGLLDVIDLVQLVDVIVGGS